MDTVRRILRGEPARSVLSEQLSSGDLGTGTHGLLGAGRFVSPFSDPEDLITTVFQITDDDSDLGDQGQRLRVQGVVDGDDDEIRVQNLKTDEEFDLTLDEIRKLMDEGEIL